MSKRPKIDPDLYLQFDRLIPPEQSRLARWWSGRSTRLLVKHSRATPIRGGWNDGYLASITTWRLFGLVRAWRRIHRY